MPKKFHEIDTWSLLSFLYVGPFYYSKHVFHQALKRSSLQKELVNLQQKCFVKLTLTETTS
jgi:hypothetical protein